MKRITNLLLVAMAVLGLASCQKGLDNELNNGDGKGDTYVGLNILFPGANLGGVKAGTEDYNKIDGEWKGRDLIKKIDVYLVTGTTAVDKTSFKAESFFGIDNNGILSPRMAVKANSGTEVKAYVVINDVKGKITTKLENVSAADFDTKFNEVIKVAAVSDVSSYDTAEKREIIVMTNSVAPVATTIEANVTEEMAKSGVKNRIDVSVLRLTSRGIVTVAKDIQKEVKVVNKLISKTGAEDKQETAKVTISDISYKVEGSALQVNPIQATDFKVPTEVYGFKPTGTWEQIKTASANIFAYSEALKVIPQDSYIESNSADNLKPALMGEEFAMSLLPVTHADDNYLKGNTPFFTIAAKFKAENLVQEITIGGEKYKAETLNTTDGATVYLGVKTGLFYSTKQKAQTMDPDYAGTDELQPAQIKQDVKEFKDGLMYYNVWINPDVPYTDTTNKIKKSPVYRNQVYNAHITGFKEIGMTSTYDGPFKPEDPLESDKTYLSVQLKVLPYTIHSYKVDLSNRY